MAGVTVSNSYVGNNPDYAVKVTDVNSVVQAGNVQHVNVDNSTVVSQLDIYVISDLDEASSPKYYGNLDKDGNWYILQLTSTTARYAKGASNYATNWTNRAGLSYDYFNLVF